MIRPVTVIAFCVAGCLARPPLANATERPNFIIILADDMGYGDITPYGGWIQTPHLDSLARHGLRLTDFHSNGTVCSPTRAALLTGRYQQRTGISMVVSVKHRDLGLPLHEVTFAELLQQAGYATAIFGKWHLGYRPTLNPIHQGFDQFRGYVSGNVDFISHIDQSGVFDWWQQDQLRDEAGYTTHLITQHALRFIDEHHDQPFCLYVPHEAPHYPYQAPGDTADRTVGGTFSNHGSRADKKQAYREMVAELDKGIGAMIARLEMHGLADKTLVFFLSDNGATRLGSNGPLRGTKGTVWEGGHRVPAIAWWPGKIRAGTCDQTVIGMDLLPTLAKLAKTELPEDLQLDGVDLSALLQSDERLEPRQLFWEHGGRQAMRDGPWKLVRSARGLKSLVGLYHLSDDVAESENLADQHPQRVAQMIAAIERWQHDVQPHKPD